MLSLYEILKASKTGIAPDMWTSLAGMNWGGADSGHEVKELTGIPPLSIRSNGTMLLDYLISGNMTQTGTPTPDNPVMPQETGDMSSNLWSYHPDTTSGGVRLLWDGEKINYSNTCTQAANSTMVIDLKKGTYTLKVNANRIPVDNDNSCIDIYHSSSGLFKRITNRNAVNGKVTFTLDDDLSNASLRIRVNKGTNYDGFEIRPMLNIGETSLPYDVYGQYKIPISSANTTTPVYLGEVETTRRVKKLVLTGKETWYFFSDSHRVWQFHISNISLGGVSMSSCMSNIAPYGITVNNRNQYDYGCYLITNGSGVAFQMNGDKDTFINTASWKSYLAAQYAAGTPVIVWYVLAEPETAVVNEPLRKIGDYADTLSYEQAGVQIPTNKGNTVIDVDTTLKPSQMYIKYQE